MKLKLGAFLVVALVASMASAQILTGTLEVIVSDAQGGRLPGAVVSASAEDSTTARETSTNGVGEATLQALQPSAMYVVEVTMDGFTSSRNENVLVRSGQTATLRVSLAVAGMAETVTVTSVTPLVDTTSALTGQDITLELTESLPTGRTYQDYLQLVPGVLPEDPRARGNPASKTGLNYRDIFGDNGVSRDNFYYIDGVNTTDGLTGTFGSNLNTEIIQEQKVITGGIPAEYMGAPGLISSVVTKSGTNTLHGSVNYFFQNDSLQAEDQNAESQNFSRFDSAFTLGGPIFMDKAWGFVSYRRVESDTDVATLDTAEFLRTVKSTQNQWYGRGTVSPSASDTLSFTYFSDPEDRDGRLERTITNARNRARELGGDNYRLAWSHLFGNDVLVDANWAKHNGEVSTIPSASGARNDIVFRGTDDRTLADEQLGAFGTSRVDQRDGQQVSIGANWNIGQHDIKGGFEWGERTRFVNNLNPDGLWTSLASHLSGTTASEVVSGDFSRERFSPENPSDVNGFNDTVNASPRKQDYLNAYDLNGDGTITGEELGAALRYNSTQGNPDGKVNYERRIQVQDGPQDFRVRDLSFFIQDTFAVGNFFFNLGVRAENYKHFATDDTSISFFDTTWAPRLSAIYDLRGDGLQKVSFFWGKYYDPIRLNMTDFAGSLTGAITEEQVYTSDLETWTTYRVRGGAKVQDALFAPTTKTPITTDLQVTYEIELAPLMSFQALYTHRNTDDILEDYDMCLYAFQDDGTTCYPGPVDHPDSLFLGLDFFGFSSFPASNFVIATLEGAERTSDHIEFVFRKRFADGWQALAAYTYSDATGNSNSDSNADFQGDVLWLDPRAPNQEGTQPGLINHLLKFAGTYRFDMGLELGGFYRWNSGTFSSKTFRAFSRNLPARAEAGAIQFAGIPSPPNRWLREDAVGTLENPSFGIFDMRIQYYINQGERANVQVFADIFNLFDNQDSIRDQDLEAGEGGVAFGEGVLFSRPRSLFLGVRLNF